MPRTTLTILLLIALAQPVTAAPTLICEVPGRTCRSLRWLPDGDGVALLARSRRRAPTRLYLKRGDRDLRPLGQARAFAFAAGRVVIERSDQLLVCDFEGDEQTKLGAGEQPIALDGEHLAFCRGGLVYRASLSGGNPQAVTSKPMIDMGLASVGKAIIFTGNGKLWRVTPNGNISLLLRNAGIDTDLGLEYFVDVTAGAEWCTVVCSGRQDAGGGATSLLLASATNGRRIDIGPGEQPAWAPDGRRFVYVSRGNLYLRSVDAQRSVQLTHEDQADFANPVWHPTGKALACTARLRDTTGDGVVDWRDAPGIYRIDLIGVISP